MKKIWYRMSFFVQGRNIGLELTILKLITIFLLVTNSFLFIGILGIITRYFVFIVNYIRFYIYFHFLFGITNCKITIIVIFYN